MKLIFTLLLGIVLGVVTTIAAYSVFFSQHQDSMIRAGQVFEMSAYYDHEALMLKNAPAEVYEELKSRQCTNLKILQEDLEYFTSLDNVLGETYRGLIEGKISRITKFHAEAGDINCPN